MATPQKSAVRFVFIMLFIMIASDVCMKSEARNVVSLRCSNEENCELLCPDCNCKCIDTWCFCPGVPLPFTNNNFTPTP
ncbi:hypothetical protein DEO72_LG10g2981 [Vigna unguiculata]|uniref:Uncharacterized protein n=1 Tax=Vigna unguiculata TaxID=3917 RepID=A0A4D6NHY1_VIGUN|nr:hypothetical protein DEO72_LG10g2981 [Vigna unguiculata]